MKPRLLLSLTGVAILQSICLTAAVHAQNYTWTGAGGDRMWSNGANWSGGSPPAGSNLASLTFSGEAPFFDPLVNNLPGVFLLNRVDFTGLTGEFYTDGGNLQFLNGASPPVISQNSAFTASLGGDILVDNASVYDRLEITGSGAGAMRLSGLLTNKQYVRVNRGADTHTAFDGGLVNSGQLNVTSGTLGLGKGITNTGGITVASTLVFSANDSYNMEPGGFLHGNAGSRIEFSGGAVNFNDANLNAMRSRGTVALNGSGLGGAADFTMDLSGGSGGFLDWRSGGFTGTAAQKATVKLGTGVIEGPSAKTIARSLTLEGGSLSWNGGDLDLGATGNLTLKNTTVKASGLAGNVIASGADNLLTLTSASLQKISGDATVMEIQPAVSAGFGSSFVTSAGGITFPKGGTFNSTFSASGTGYFEFTGTTNLLGSTRITGGPDAVRLTSGSFNINEYGAGIEAGVVLESGVTLGGTASLFGIGSFPGSAFKWNGGTISGPAGSSVPISGQTILATSATKTIDTRRVGLSNGLWTGGDIVLKDSVLGVGQMIVQSDQSISRTGSTGGLTITGSGLTKNTTTGTTTINVPVDVQNGGIRANTGRILLTGGGAALGKFESITGGTVEFGGGNYEINNTIGFGGSVALGSRGVGNFLISAGEVRINATGSSVNNSAALTLAEGGALAGTAASYSMGGTAFHWTGGSVTGPAGSGVNITAPTTISGSAVKTIDTRNVTLSNGVWTGGDITITGAQLSLTGTTSVQAPNTLGGTGTVVNSGQFIKSTPSVTTITAGFTNNASVLVNEGTLRVDSTLDGTGVVVVGAAGRLGGSGTIGNVTTVSGTLAPGSSPGTMTFNADTTLLAGSTYEWELGAFSDTAAGGVPGTDWDMLSGAGTAVITFQLGSMLTLNFDGISDPNGVNAFWDGVTDRSWLIASSTGGLVDQGLSITNPNWNTGVFSLSDDGTDLRLNFAAVPEPGSLSVIGAGWPRCFSRAAAAEPAESSPGKTGSVPRAGAEKNTARILLRHFRKCVLKLPFP